jgi:hypothetical protein
MTPTSQLLIINSPYFMNQPLRTLGVAPNAWTVDREHADITRPPLNPQPAILATETKILRLDWAKTAILVIDMQNDFCHPDGAYRGRRNSSPSTHRTFTNLVA